MTVIAAMMISIFSACGDPKYQAPAIVVAFSAEFPPPTALSTSMTAGIAAVVSNDPKNAGVLFSCMPTGMCGSFMPNPIASDIPTTYQAPPMIPQGGSVTITATSVTDNTKFVSATITIE